MFYDRSYAIHTAYWHDSFGREVSHGCVNVAPLDARFLFGWTAPVVPPGWSYINATDDEPGSLVRIRRR